MDEIVCKKVGSDPENYVCKREAKKEIFRVPKHAPKKLKAPAIPSVIDTVPEKEIPKPNIQYAGKIFYTEDVYTNCTATLIYQYYVKVSKLSDGPSTTKWMETVVRYMNKSEPGTDSIERALWGIASALNEYKISYVLIGGGPPSERDNDPCLWDRISREFLTPDKVLEKKMGACLETSLLAFATLSRLGFHPVLIGDYGHIGVGILAEKKQGNLTPATTIYKGKKVYIYSIDTTDITGEIDFFKRKSMSNNELSRAFKEALKKGLKLTVDISSLWHQGEIVDQKGNAIISKPCHEDGGVYSQCPNKSQEVNLDWRWRRFKTEQMENISDKKGFGYSGIHIRNW